MKNKRFMAALLAGTMVLSNGAAVNADMKYEAGLPAQSDSSSSLVDVLAPLSDIPAFPGADGYAKYVTGGRGGKVIHVTNLNASGEGSLTAALENGGNTSEPRIIVFDVSGTIVIGKELYKKSYSNVTIAGQTAPGEGITITNENFYLAHSDNVIIRFIKFRHGQATAKDDSFYVQNSTNIMIDHCSFEYGSDESCSARNTSNLTFQWSILSNGVRTHSMGGLQEWSSETIYHCLMGNQNDRNPKAKGIMDFTNNVVYNWGDYPFVAGGNSGGQGWGNVVNNYFIAGSDTKDPNHAITRSNGKYFLYLAGNLIDSNKNGKLDGVNTGIDMIATYNDAKYSDRFTFPDDYTLPLVLIKNRMAMAELDYVDSAEEAYYKVMDFSGASIYYNSDGTTELFHDDIDKEILSGVQNQTGKLLLHNKESYNENGEIFDKNFINSRPQINVNDPSSEWYRPDTDQDGMPDAWEIANGLDPNNPEDRNNKNDVGYTMLEVYLNELAEPAFPDDTYSIADRQIAEVQKPLRACTLVLEKDGEKETYPVINGENQIMIPLAPVAEYLGYKMINVAEDTVTMQYPEEFPLGGLNCEGNNNVVTFSAGDVKFNETLVSYEGMLYMPINYVSYGMVGVYDQVLVSEEDNTVNIYIKDAEFYKDWHTNEDRQNRLKSAPSMIVELTEENLKITFDKEAAFADTTAKISITKKTPSSTVSESVYNNVYSTSTFTANISDMDIWGSNKVAVIDYYNFNSDGEGFTLDETSTYTVKIDAGAFADYYNDYYGTNYVTDKKEFSINSISKTTNNPSSKEVNEETENEYFVQEDTSTVTVKELVQAVYKLLAMKEINVSNYDQINDGTIIPDDDDSKDDDGKDDDNKDDDNKDDNDNKDDDNKDDNDDKDDDNKDDNDDKDDDSNDDDYDSDDETEPEEPQLPTMIDKETMEETGNISGTDSKEIEIIVDEKVEVTKEAVDEIIKQEKDLVINTGNTSLTISNSTFTSGNIETKFEISAETPSSKDLKEIKNDIKNDSNITELISSKEISIKADGEEIDLVNKEPLTVSVKIPNSVKDTDKLTAVRYEVQEDGSLKAVKIGGTYDAETKSFTYRTDKTGIIAVVKAEDVKQVKLTIGANEMNINGQNVVNDVAPVVENDRTYLPIRVIAESLGAEVGWDQETQSVTVTLNGKTLRFNVNEEIDGYGKPLVKNERTLVPIRYISEQLGANVLWVPSTNEIEIVR